MRAGLVLFAMMSVAHAAPAPAPAATAPTTPTAPAPTATAPTAPAATAPTAPTAPSAPDTTLPFAGPTAVGPVASEQVAPPGQQPTPPAIVAPRRGVMSRRWAIALAFGTESLRAQPADAQTLAIETGELSGRFRIIPAIEVALTLQGGGSYNGLYSASTVMADFRYRFMAEQALNIYAIAGLGVGSASGKNPTDFEKKGRGAFRIGAGGELRFDPLALFAELRLYGIGENKEVPDPTQSSTRYEIARFGVSGIALVLGATWYF